MRRVVLVRLAFDEEATLFVVSMPRSNVEEDNFPCLPNEVPLGIAIRVRTTARQNNFSSVLCSHHIRRTLAAFGGIPAGRYLSLFLLSPHVSHCGSTLECLTPVVCESGAMISIFPGNRGWHA